MKIKYLILNYCMFLNLISLAGDVNEMDWETLVEFQIEGGALDGENFSLNLSSSTSYSELREKVSERCNDQNFWLITRKSPFDLESDEPINLDEIKESGFISVVMKP